MTARASVRASGAGWFSFSHLSAGFIAVLVGYTSSAAIVFQAAHAAGATAAEISSWLWALGIGMGLTCIGLSLYFRSPVLTAWSTPGAALLVTGLAGLPMAEAVGIFLFNALLITVAGFSGWFDRLMRHVPQTLTAAMREPIRDISVTAGRMERDAPLFFGSGSNPTLFN